MRRYKAYYSRRDMKKHRCSDHAFGIDRYSGGDVELIIQFRIQSTLSA